jgi:hypothetical protein
MNNPKVTLCVTSCCRQDLLDKTLDSFFKYNTYPIERVIISEDSGIAPIVNYDCEILTGKVGQIASIDRMYAMVDTPYIFHAEEDWLWYKSGFIEESLSIMEKHPDILQVWLREQNDTNNHPIIYDNEWFDIVQHSIGRWHGFSLNPGLKRLSDYKLIEGGYASVGHEVDLSEFYYSKGFIAAITKQGYVRHIGQHRTVKDTLRNTKPI